MNSGLEKIFGRAALAVVALTAANVPPFNRASAADAKPIGTFKTDNRSAFDRVKISDIRGAGKTPEGGNASSIAISKYDLIILQIRGTDPELIAKGKEAVASVMIEDKTLKAAIVLTEGDSRMLSIHYKGVTTGEIGPIHSWNPSLLIGMRTALKDAPVYYSERLGSLKAKTPAGAQTPELKR